MLEMRDVCEKCSAHLTESGEVKRPGLRDCSGYWVTASRAVVV